MGFGCLIAANAFMRSWVWTGIMDGARNPRQLITRVLTKTLGDSLDLTSMLSIRDPK